MPRINMTNEWSLEIDSDFRRRIEEGCLVLWRSQQTIWVAIYEHNDIPPDVFAQLKQESHPNPEQTFELQQGNLMKYAYLLPNADGDERSWELTTFSVAESDYALMSYYFDEREMLEWALKCWRSVECHLL